MDGLRAVAVLPVVLFHAGLDTVSGGFAGVDVFFVISGFLITRLLRDEMAAGRLSLLRFYERRARRLLPALLPVLAFALAGAAWLYLPTDFRPVPRSAAAALGFSANILFWWEAGYFDAPSQVKPLLNLWSLAVEEQFYLLFPPLLVLLQRNAPRGTAPALAVGALLSFLGGAVWTGQDPSAAFFLVPARAWELLAGALLALAAPRLAPGPAREAAAAGGLMLIGATFLLATERTPWPGVAALGPVLGAVLVIGAGEGTRTGRLLSLPPALLVGRLSYSLYLWHWPLLVFARYWKTGPLSFGETAAVLFLSVLLAFLSWRFVERPFRYPPGHPRHVARRPLLSAAAGAGGMLLAVAGLLWTSNGWPSRFPAEVVRLDGYAGSFDRRARACGGTLGRCVYGAPAPPSFAVWSDSQGQQLLPVLGEWGRGRGTAVLQLTFPGCAPALGAFSGERPGCGRFNARALERLAADPKIRAVLLAANLDNDRYRHSTVFRRGFAGVVERLQHAGKRVVLVYPHPVQQGSPPRVIARRAMQDRSVSDYGVSRADFLRRNAGLFAFLDRVGGPATIRVRPHLALCATGRCAPYHQGEVLWVDGAHLSNEGVQFISQPLFAAAERALSPPALRR